MRDIASLQMLPETGPGPLGAVCRPLNSVNTGTLTNYGCDTSLCQDD